MSKHSEKGTIISVGEVQFLGQNGFKKRTFVMQNGSDKYPNKLEFELHKDAADKPPSLGPAEVDFYLEGREFIGNKGTTYFKTLKVCEIRQSSQPQAAPEYPPMTSTVAKSRPTEQPQGDEDNLPF